MNKIAKRIIAIVCLVTLIAMPIVMTKAFAISFNMESNESKLKVFIGSSRSINPITVESYKNNRKKFLVDLAESNPTTNYDAVCVLNDYYSIQDIENLSQNQNIVIRRVYLWTPAQTGRISLSVDYNDIGETVNRIYNTALSNKGTEFYDGADEAIISMIEEKSYGIFAITIESSAETLNILSDIEMFEFIDVKYSEQAEKKALDSGLLLEYIELPFKPDGAL